MTSRERKITLFVLVWLTLFHYESLRHGFLSPFFGRELPKIRLLFPPAGWIMFFYVGETEVRAEVHGKKGDDLEPIDPHRIFDNHWLGYDNIRRNVLVSVLDPSLARRFGLYLHRKFPEVDSFYVMQAVYPSHRRYPGQRKLGVVYVC